LDVMNLLFKIQWKSCIQLVPIGCDLTGYYGFHFVTQLVSVSLLSHLFCTCNIFIHISIGMKIVHQQNCTNISSKQNKIHMNTKMMT